MTDGGTERKEKAGEERIERGKKDGAKTGRERRRVGQSKCEREEVTEERMQTKEEEG